MTNALIFGLTGQDGAYLAKFLLEKGYNVFVVSDAIASRELTSYETALTRLEQADVWLLNTESVLFEWLRDAAHPEFKSLSKLIL